MAFSRVKPVSATSMAYVHHYSDMMLSQKDKGAHGELESSTGVTLDAVRSYFSQVPVTRSGTLIRENQQSSTKDGGRKLFGKAPWHRKGSGTSEISTTSSVRKILRGRTPPGSVSSGTGTQNSGKHHLTPTGTRYR
jgi:hypothetical protein